MNKTFNSNTVPYSIVAANPDGALHSGLWWLKSAGVINDSRNGRVAVAPAPVITVYPYPDRRVILSPLRDANPFFHLFEALWMLAGRNDVAKIAVYAKQMEAFADDGLQWGAYGFRWREFFAFDQLKELIELIRRDPKTRRAVLTMWSPNGDLVMENGYGGVDAKDVPCNTQVYFDGTSGVLNMTVMNRSNDIVWGAYGANLVHMSMLHEFMASAVKLPLGTYYQFSNNYHAYIDRPDVQRLLEASSPDREQWAVRFKPGSCVYADHGVTPYPMMANEGYWDSWLRECETFVEQPHDAGIIYAHPFFSEVARPLMLAHLAYKQGDLDPALELASECQALDWRLAATEWLLRRRAKSQEAARKLMEGGQ